MAASLLEKLPHVLQLSETCPSFICTFLRKFLNEMSNFCSTESLKMEGVQMRGWTMGEGRYSNNLFTARRQSWNCNKLKEKSFFFFLFSFIFIYKISFISCYRILCCSATAFHIVGLIKTLVANLRRGCTNRNHSIREPEMSAVKDNYGTFCAPIISAISSHSVL